MRRSNTPEAEDSDDIAFRTSLTSDFNDVKTLMAACGQYEKAQQTVLDAGFADSFIQMDHLERSGSRIAVLQALADMGVAHISSWDREHLSQLAEQVRDFQ